MPIFELHFITTGRETYRVEAPDADTAREQAFDLIDSEPVYAEHELGELEDVEEIA